MTNQTAVTAIAGSISRAPIDSSPTSDPLAPALMMTAISSENTKMPAASQ
ncbi:MAG: hypothetical protein R2731_10290 [Nocardioides sp.]